MRRQRIPYQRIVFVCVNKRQPQEICCANRNSEAIAAALKERVKALGLSRVVRVSKSGCQDVCARGPNVMVFPDGVWYDGVALEDVERILHEITRGLPALPAATPAGLPARPAPPAPARPRRSPRSNPSPTDLPVRP